MEHKEANSITQAKIYLDQNIYSNLAKQGEKWNKSKLGKVLLSAIEENRAHVWVSPSNIIELALHRDAEIGIRTARIMLELCQAKNVIHSFEFEFVSQFMSILDCIFPSAIFTREFYNYSANINTKLYLGYLGLFGATEEVYNTDIIDLLRKEKLHNQLLHAWFAANPEYWIDGMLKNIDEMLISRKSLFDNMESLTCDEIENEIEKLRKQVKPLSRQQLNLLNKTRNKISNAYGAMEIGECISSVFRNPFELQLTFNTEHIVRQWDLVLKALKCKPLSPETSEASDLELMSNYNIAIYVLQQFIYALIEKGLLCASFRYQTILLDIQKSINRKELPTKGLVFDANHVVALQNSDIFMSRDSNLQGSARSLAKVLRDKSGDIISPIIVNDARQLDKAIGTINSNPAF